jgi:hypothetical protein
MAPRAYAPPSGAPFSAPVAAGWRERALLVTLYVTMAVSSIAFIEPSPHDGLMGLLALMCLIAGVRVDRHLALLLLLLLFLNAGGLLSLFNVPGQEQTVQYAVTSLYLALAAMVFACLFADNTMPRIETMRTAYVLSAVIAAIAGICGYFRLFPGAEDLFLLYGRAQGTFKDPNVYGPYLIWPTLIVLERMFMRRITLFDAATVGVLLLGLLLSFSRGAWFHFLVSCAVMIALSMLTTSSIRVRLRIVGLCVVGFAALAAFVALALSVDTVGHMFKERFHLLNAYDVGQGGRFRLQELALGAVLKFPNGMGPFEFSRVHGLQQHNVYLQAFLVYGWVGGVSYILILCTTLMMALRTVFTATPWRPYLIVALATFIGEIVEGFVIDTDHWRHFFLLIGIIWGLGAATLKYRHGHARAV